MKHELRNQKFLLCDPASYEARCRMVDDYEPSRKERAAIDYTVDIWGDPIPQPENVNGIAVIPLVGVVSQDLPRMFKKFGYLDLGEFRQNLINAATDPAVKQICILAKSPGGMTRGVPEAAALVAMVEGMKSVFTYAAGDLASAAYYICAASTGIAGAPSSEIGAIGVYANIPTDKSFWANMGISWNMFKSGKYKGAGDTGQDLTEDQKQEIQTQIDDAGAEFRAHVTQCRPGVSLDSMQGQTFSGDSAVVSGFADMIAPDLASMIGNLTLIQ